MARYLVYNQVWLWFSGFNFYVREVKHFTNIFPCWFVFFFLLWGDTDFPSIMCFGHYSLASCVHCKCPSLDDCFSSHCPFLYSDGNWTQGLAHTKQALHWPISLPRSHPCGIFKINTNSEFQCLASLFVFYQGFGPHLKDFPPSEVMKRLSSVIC